ncbi:hypothetical protein HELRODRAFT_80592, partial [Helobdella robusta]|uniref:Fibrinogen C-terminal domain-containing protein n=1 Tax=Helobdella robusta TaxID=6412 RepID=T1G424_HELRO
VIQRRMDGSENFFRNWEDYKNGFGDPCKEFWIGNDNLYRLTSRNSYKLVVVLADFERNVACAAYDSFNVGSPASNYTLNIGKYIGTAGDSLAGHNGMQFSTYDRDNDHESYSCAAYFQGAWWYNRCHLSNLNGRYLSGFYNTSYANGINWKTFRGFYYSLAFTEMRIELI